MLVDHKKNDLGIKGYLKCDLFMFYENENTINTLLIPKSVDSLIEDIEINEKCVEILLILTFEAVI